MINFCFDNFKPVNCYPWPNLVPMDHDKITVSPLGRVIIHDANWGTTPPWSSDAMLVRFLHMLGMEYLIWDTETAPVGSFYLVDLCLFNQQGFDYFAYLSPAALQRLQQREIKLLITYGEADLAAPIQDCVFALCDRYHINPVDVLISLGCTVPSYSPSNFYHLNEDYFSYLYAQSWAQTEPLYWHGEPREKVMTVLTRVHKDWRAYFSSWFWHRSHNQHCYFSYNMVDYDKNMLQSDDMSPWGIMMADHPELQMQIHEFLAQCPFVADQLDNTENNRQIHRVDQHFTNSYWNLVLETTMDMAHQLPGVFITEKTWKPIANAQPFIILGNAHSLTYLRDQGYRTFCEIGIDESYDDIVDSADRMRAVCALVDDIFNWSPNTHLEVMHNAREIVEHNQRIFWHTARAQLQDFIDQIIDGKPRRSPY